MKEDPRKFVGSMFELAFGAADEKLSREEVRNHLKEAGVDPDAAWARTSKILAAARGRLRMEDARAARVAASSTPSVTESVAAAKDKVIAQIQELFAQVSSGAAGMYARNWNETAVEDLIAVRDQLQRTLEREAKRRDGK
jgi:hypothetical protein